MPLRPVPALLIVFVSRPQLIAESRQSGSSLLHMNPGSFPLFCITVTIYRYIRLYDRLAPSIPLISARGAKISWILRHTKLSDFCAFAWWASGLIDAPWRSCPCTSPVSPLFYIARAVAVATPCRFAPANRSLTTPPPSSSSEEAAERARARAGRQTRDRYVLNCSLIGADVPALPVWLCRIPFLGYSRRALQCCT